MKNEKALKNLMEEMKESIMQNNIHEVLDYWYDIKDLLEEEGVM